MEPEVLKFLQRIGWSIFLGFTWMAINTSFGIMLNWGFYKIRPSMGNYIFWVWFVASGLALAWYMYKLWSRPLGLPRHEAETGWR